VDNAVLDRKQLERLARRIAERTNAEKEVADKKIVKKDS